MGTERRLVARGQRSPEPLRQHHTGPSPISSLAGSSPLPGQEVNGTLSLTARTDKGNVFLDYYGVSTSNFRAPATGWRRVDVWFGAPSTASLIWHDLRIVIQSTATVRFANLTLPNTNPPFRDGGPGDPTPPPDLVNCPDCKFFDPGVPTPIETVNGFGTGQTNCIRLLGSSFAEAPSDNTCTLFIPTTEVPQFRLEIDDLPGSCLSYSGTALVVVPCAVAPVWIDIRDGSVPNGFTMQPQGYPGCLARRATE